jgi:hypothetical protein
VELCMIGLCMIDLGDVRKGLNTETAKLGTINNFLMENPSIEALIVLKKRAHMAP